MRKIRHFLLTTLAVLCSTLTTWAQITFENAEGTLKFTVTDGNNVSVSKGTNEPSGAIDIPSEATDPESGTLYMVTSIGNSAFSSCYMLTSINIPENVTSIGNYAFGSCSRLTTVTFSGTSQLETIGREVFYRCDKLASINIPESITSIGSEAFSGCSSLQRNEYGNAKYLKISENSYLLLESATSTDITECEINSDCKFICFAAFRNCSGLTSVTIPSGVMSVGDYAFDNCVNLTKVTIYSDAVASESYSGSSNNNEKFGNQVTEYVFGEDVTAIGDYAFCTCSGITSVTFSGTSKLKTIGRQAFSQCSGLTTITIPSSVDSIANGAFFYSRNFQEIVFDGETPPKFGTSVFENTNDCPIYVPATAYTAYKEAPNMSYYANRVEAKPVEVDGIMYRMQEEGTFAVVANNYSGEVVIPSSVNFNGNDVAVTKISGSAFRNCTDLTSVTIPNSITLIDWYAFENCPGLTTINIPNSITSINSNVFTGCTGLTSITTECDVIGDANLYFTKDGIRYRVLNKESVEIASCSCSGELVIQDTVTAGNTFNITRIANNALANCTDLTKVTINSNAIASKDYTSSNNLNTIFGSQVTEYVLGGGVTSIGNNAFYGCTSMTTLTINESVISISGNAFSGCDNIETLTFNTNAIGSTFSDKPSLKTINIGDSVTSLSWMAFENCTGLTSVNIPGNVATIGMHSFIGCTGLTSVTINEGVTTIANYAFSGCTNLATIIIPESVTSTGQRVFEGCTGLTSITMNSNASNFSLAGLCIIRDGIYYKVLKKASVAVVTNDYSGDIVIPETVTVGDIFNVTDIDTRAFYDCNSLTSVTFESETPPAFGLSAFYKSNNCPIYVPTPAALTAYKNAENMSGYANRVKIRPVEVDGVKYELKEDATFTVVANNYSGEVVIRDSIDYNGVPTPVTTISASAFSGCSDLTSVTIPESITTISSNVFNDCTGLTSITIPSSITSIDNNAFDGCTGLTKVTINSNAIATNSYDVNFNMKYMFGSQVTEYVFGEGITKIGPYAFYNTSLTSVTIPESVTSIGIYAFFQCSGLSSITIPEGVISIGINAFGNCTSLTSLTIPKSVTSIGNSAFSNCTNIQEFILERTTPPSFGTNVFSGSTCPIYVYTVGAYKQAENMDVFVNRVHVIPTIIVVNGVKYQIKDEGTFEVVANNYSDEVVISDSIDLNGVAIAVSSISSDAFSGCTGLTAVTIPETVTSIGNGAFSGCDNIETLTYNTNKIGTTFRGNTSLKTINIGNAVTSIGASAFNGCTGLTTVNIPETVKTIGQQAFYNCSSLNSVTLPESLTSIGEKTFYNCSSLASITVLVSVASETFYGCSSLKEVTFGSSVKTIWYDAFTGCSSLETVNFNATNCTSMSYLSKSVFNDFSSIKTLNIGDNVETIPDYAFRGCTGLTSVKVPSSVTKMGVMAFAGCSGLTSITLPFVGKDAQTPMYPLGYIFGTTSYEGGTATQQQSISGSSNYYIPTALKEVVITGGSFISNYAFQNCSGLTSITIPDSVTSIGGSAFWKCSGLTSINIPEGVTSIGNFAFYGCSGLTSITIPAGVTSIGMRALYGCKSLRSISLPFVGDEPHDTAETGQWPFGYIFGQDDGDFSVNGFIRIFQPCGIGSEGTNYFFIPRLLEEVVITGNSSITNRAFYNCTTLKSITIGDSVTIIGDNAFYNCSNIEKFVFEGETPPTFGYAAFDISKSRPIYVPTEEAVTAYRAAENIQTSSYDYRSRIMVNPNCKINVVANNSDYGTVSGSGTYNINTTQTVTIAATPYEHYRFVRWEEDGVTDNPRIVALNGYATFTAVFAEHLLDSLAIENIVAPTCTVAGSYDSVVYCSVCRVELSRHVIDVPAAGHKADSVVFENVVAATRTAAGSYDSVVYCSVCKVELSRTTVEVPQILAESIKLASKPNKVEYKQGEALDVKGGKITIGYTDKSTEDFEILAGWVSGFNSEKVGKQTLTVTFESVSSTLTTTFDVTVSKEDDNTAIDEDAANTVNIYAYQNVIVVENANAEIYVYDAMGRLVERNIGNNSRTEIRMNNAGVYIVKVGNTAKRVMVK